MNNIKIAIIGLGYVGLPLAVKFSEKFKVIGYDINSTRIKNLEKGFDETNEISEEALKGAKPQLKLSTERADLESCNIYIVTVPTPIDSNKVPDLNPLKKASKLVGSVLKNGDHVIYESTVFPGCTEEVCVPILEKESNLKLNVDFFIGYSPERINPGDKINTLEKIVKVTSGSTRNAAEFIDQLYNQIITAGTFKASSIKVAEASKAIENAQRDLNISFFNELALIFDLIGISTNEVIEAASTKWNFIKLSPGLVGGHCIGVDPYYLAHKATELGHHPEIILSGRRVNDRIANFIVDKTMKELIKTNSNFKEIEILILGITFKENCPDTRNSKVIDLINALREYNIEPDIYDPVVVKEKVEKEYSLRLLEKIKNQYDAVIIPVAHNQFKEIDYNQILKTPDSLIFDVKSILSTTNLKILRL